MRSRHVHFTTKWEKSYHGAHKTAGLSEVTYRVAPGWSREKRSQKGPHCLHNKGGPLCPRVLQHRSSRIPAFPSLRSLEFGCVSGRGGQRDQPPAETLGTPSLMSLPGRRQLPQVTTARCSGIKAPGVTTTPGGSSRSLCLVSPQGTPRPYPR